MGRGKRVERVEDVFELGQPVEVRVDDIDPQGKVSLSLVGDESAADAPESGGRSGRDGGGRDGGRSGGGRNGGGRGSSGRGEKSETPNGAKTGAASFEDVFEEELLEEFGDLGPAAAETHDRPSGGGGGRGGRRRR
jgi:polyribonucleotide nucleotidyltransferase